MLTARFCIPSSHPCLADHFPGHPIAPGVLTLDLVSQGLLEQQPGMRLAGISQAKFLQPVFPLQEIEITYTSTAKNTYKFVCMHAGQTLVTGKIQLCPKVALIG